MKASHPKPPAGKTKPRSTPTKRILIVDDHPLTRDGVSHRLQIEADLEVCGEVGTAKAALAAVRQSPPDLVLADLSLAERTGLELIKDLHVLHPDVPVLVFSMHFETLYAERVLRAGGRGYIMKSAGAAKLVEAVRSVLRGEVYLSEAMRDHVIHRFAGGPAAIAGNNTGSLSDRELEVFELIGQGKSTRDIAAQLQVSTSTVETHRAHLKEKLDLRRATDLVRSAVEWVATRDR
jgi:DNA-binding NarL/FixJ family response regulator